MLSYFLCFYNVSDAKVIDKSQKRAVKEVLKKQKPELPTWRSGIMRNYLSKQNYSLAIVQQLAGPEEQIGAGPGLPACGCT
jgi:hypothetical protein